MKRDCEACGSADLESIHEQGFVVIGQTDRVGYRVVACRECGFAFASDVPDQPAWERYYKNNAKHLYGEKLPDGLQAIHDDTYRCLATELLDRPEVRDRRDEFRILEVGCACGHFLDKLRRVGFKRLTGIEPSSDAAARARDLFGLEVLNEPLARFTGSANYDLVVMSGVLEHVVDLAQTVGRIRELLADGGHVFWLVPDASRFTEVVIREPHFEFALEHVNFFSRDSLGRLASRFGLEEAAATSLYNDFYNNYNLLALYRPGDAGALDRSRDEATVRVLREYTELSDRRITAIDAMLAPYVQSGRRLAVWGTGMFTSRLLADSRLRDANVVRFVDSNTKVQGRRLCGLPVEPPSVLQQDDCPVLVASVVFAEEIRGILQHEYGYRGTILTLNEA
jgi:hypothetical protein